MGRFGIVVGIPYRAVLGKMADGYWMRGCSIAGFLWRSLEGRELDDGEFGAG